jgi:N-acetylglucosamine kinase-like BadF-type ATPase
MAVCHAVLGHEKGIACILGTGANSCLYDGNDIMERAVSLGYLLGDEGSGCYIGRKLVRAYFYDLMPLELKLSFHLAYNLEINEFIKRVYHEPEASKYLAEFTKFAGEHLAHPYIQKLIKDSFSDFIQAFVLRYTDCRTLPVSFVGSVAFAFQDLLRESLEAEGLTLGKVMQSPAEGLIQMYS